MSHLFIDDDTQKNGTIINFIQIFSFSKIEDVIKKFNAKLILLAFLLPQKINEKIY